MAANLRDDVAHILANEVMRINNAIPPVSDRVIIFDMCLQHEREGWFREKSRFTLHFETPFKEPTWDEDYDEEAGFQWHLYTFHDGNGEFLITLQYELDLANSKDVIYKFNAKTNKLSYFSSSDNVTYDKEKKIVSIPYEEEISWDIKAQLFVNKNRD